MTEHANDRTTAHTLHCAHAHHRAHTHHRAQAHGRAHPDHTTRPPRTVTRRPADQSSAVVMEIGYARSGTPTDSISARNDQLTAAGCTRIFIDVSDHDRPNDLPEWSKCLGVQRAGDRITVPALIHLAPTDTIALTILRDLAGRGVRFRSLDEPWMNLDANTDKGASLLKIMTTLVELRTITSRANTLRGIELARAQGRVGGRPTVMTPERIELARRMRNASPPLSYERIAATLGVSRNSVIRALTRHT